MSKTAFTIGIEEEYLLVDPETRDVVSEPPAGLLEACERVLGKRVAPEMMRCQIEIGTSVCQDHHQARAQLRELRGCVRDVTAEHGLTFVAASTHPFAEWSAQRATPKERYEALLRDMQAAIHRMLICGMHVHVAIEDEALRHDIFGQIGYFMPHLLALSTSSPFWQGHLSGLSSYRLSVFDGMPRTGLPESFASVQEYERTIAVLVEAGLIEDASKVWWDLRPSTKYPTLEMRVTDVCTRIEDAVAIACLYRCLCRMLMRLRARNQRWRAYSRFLVSENRWLAQRHGVSRGLIDFGRGTIVPMTVLVDELIELTAEDAAYFGCEDELARLRTIAAEGTSADRQIAVYTAATERGADPGLALRDVVDHLVAETAETLD